MHIREFTDLFAFDPQKRYFIGLEEEFWLTDDSGFLKDKALELLQRAAHDKLNIAPEQWELNNGVLTKKMETTILQDLRDKVGLQAELPMSQIETHTYPCTDIVHAYRDMRKRRRFLKELAGYLDVHVLPVGAPLFPFKTNVFPLEYFQWVHKVFAERLKKGFISGMHVHIGVGSIGEAIKAYNALREYLPIFLAISTNSAISFGGKSGFEANRYIHYLSVAGEVIPNYLHSWQDYYEDLKRRDCHLDPTRNWKILRIHPFGTVEVRIADTQLTFTETVMIAAIVQLIVYKTLTSGGPEKYTDDATLDVQLYQAARYGISHRGSNMPLIPKIIEMMKSVKPYLKDLAGAEKNYQLMKELLKTRQNGSARQLEYFEQCNQDPKQLFELIYQDSITGL